MEQQSKRGYLLYILLGIIVFGTAAIIYQYGSFALLPKRATVQQEILAESILREAEYCINKGRYADVINLLKRFQPQASENHYITTLLVYSFYHNGNLQQAEQLCRQFLIRNPQDIRQRNNLGAILLRQGKLDAAITELTKAAKLAPEYPLILQNLSNALFANGQIELSSKYQNSIRFILWCGLADTKPYMISIPAVLQPPSVRKETTL